MKFEHSVNEFYVTDFGAIGDGKTINTACIQNAIDTCYQSGGGNVIFPNGEYITGTLFMRSYITLKLEVNAVLKGSREQGHYPVDSTLVHKQRYDLEPHMNPALIYCEDCEDIMFVGPGTIHGNGQEWEGYYRPMLIRFLRCRNVRMRDLRLRNPASWNTAFLECEKVYVHGVDIISINNGNGDGLDFDACSDVIVSDCNLDCSDDCICLQNSVKNKKCKNVTITNCVMTSKWAAFRIGLLSRGDFQDITISNCVIHDVECSGFKIQMSEGGVLNNILVENIVMRDVPRPIMITHNRFKFYVDGEIPIPKTGVVSGIKFNNILIDVDKEKGYIKNSGIIIQGLPDAIISNIELNNIDYTVYGADRVPEIDLDSVPSIDDQRPEYFVWDNKLPCYGLFLDNVREISIQNLKIRCLFPSNKPAIAMRNVTDVEIDHLRLSQSQNTECITMHCVEKIDISSFRPYGNVSNLIKKDN